MAKSELDKHFNLVNASTYFGNLNTGQFIDPTRHHLNEKNQTFGMPLNQVLYWRM